MEDLPSITSRRSSRSAALRAWLHDHTLQRLDIIAAGCYSDDPSVEELRAVAALAAAELRAVVDCGLDGPPACTIFEALTDVIAEAQASAGGTEFLFERRGDNGDVPPYVVGELAAATAELLANICKHSGAACAIVACTVEHGVVTVRVEDNGAGFDTSTIHPRAGLVRSVVGRAIRLGGTARIRSQVAIGTTVVITVALDRVPREGLA